jgi:hypothetical protein
MSEPHPPPSPEPLDEIATLGSGARVRDRDTGAESSSDDWVAARMAAENRPRDECLDELMNALARGDLTIVRPGTA